MVSLGRGGLGRGGLFRERWSLALYGSQNKLFEVGRSK